MSFTEITDKALHKFAKEGLKPDSADLSRGDTIADGIFKLIQQKSRFPPDRCIIGGSRGKATAIPGFDYDLVVFVNDKTPPFDDILNDYEYVLEVTDLFKIRHLTRTKHSVQFEVNGIEVDLLPASNFVNGMQNLSGDALAKEQGARVLQKIQELYRMRPGITYDYSSSLVESHVLFMKHQSAFVHELARICKFWNKTLVLGDKVSGQSTIIELIATYAGNIERNNQSSPSTLRAFRTFLQQMKNLDNMGIKFDTEILNLTCSAPTFSKPFLVEPSNPFNNLLKDIDRGIIEKFKTFAAETLRRLENEVYIWSKLGYFPLELLFEAQPKILRSRTTPSKSRVTVSAGTSKNPNMIVRNEKKFDKEILDMQRTIKNTMLAAIHAFTSSDRSAVSEDQVAEIARRQVDHHAFGVESSPWGDSGGTHEEHDVTFEIPFADRPKIIQASFSWA